MMNLPQSFFFSKGEFQIQKKKLLEVSPPRCLLLLLQRFLSPDAQLISPEQLGF